MKLDVLRAELAKEVRLHVTRVVRTVAFLSKPYGGPRAERPSGMAWERSCEDSKDVTLLTWKSINHFLFLSTEGFL